MVFINLVSERNINFDKFLKSVKLRKRRGDPCVYFDKGNELTASVYVDNFLVMSSKDSTIHQFKDNIGAVFEVRDIGEMHYVLSIVIKKNKYCSVTLDRNAKCPNAKGASTALDTDMRYVPASKDNMLRAE